jgi:Fe-S-cluster containining protein
MDSFKLNREISYVGKIGKLREEFCIGYTEFKRERVKDVERVQIDLTTSRGETITCTKGCSVCCSQYTTATIQECETIVYYLCQNDDILSNYLQKYTLWRERLRAKGDFCQKPGQSYDEELAAQHGEQMRQAFLEEETRYGSRVFCPFLHDSICSIYEVRPYMCAAFIATTPPEWCNPSNPNEPHYYKVGRSDVMSDLSFYHKGLGEPFISIMPLVVYEILQTGYSYISSISGLEGLADEAIEDPKIRAILMR